MAFWALSFLMPNAGVSHARPLRAVVPELASEMAEEGEDYSEFLICIEGRTGREARRLFVSKETQR